MNVDQKILSRLQTLLQTGQEVLRTKSKTNESGNSYLGEFAVSGELASQWVTSCLNLLGRVFGRDGEHYLRFKEEADNFEIHSSIIKAFGVLKAAKDDYEGGHLFDARVIIQAEIFDDFLDQAKHLFELGYHGPAAVIAGSVLEDGLRKLSAREGIPISAKPKVDTMNAQLAKAGVYNVLTQKQITALADLRNKAAHGNWNEFTKEDV